MVTLSCSIFFTRNIFIIGVILLVETVVELLVIAATNGELVRPTSLNDVFDWLLERVRHVAHDGEDGESGEDRGGAVDHAHQDRVAEAVVVELVVGGESDQAAPRRAQREEDLSRRVLPNLRSNPKASGFESFSKRQRTGKAFCSNTWSFMNSFYSVSLK